MSVTQGVTLYTQYVGRVDSCPRCGEEHDNLYFAPMSGTDSLWAQCPENMQPIVTSVEEAEDGGVRDMLARFMQEGTVKREEA